MGTRFLLLGLRPLPNVRRPPDELLSVVVDTLARCLATAALVVGRVLEDVDVPGLLF